MTQEEKFLLLQDLCARLPYHTIVSTGEENLELVKVDILNGLVYVFSESFLEFDAFEIKPYLRPMSSMTDAEKKELWELLKKLGMISDVKRLDWLLSKGFDVRNLIEKGLALEAPKDMYK